MNIDKRIEEMLAGKYFVVALNNSDKYIRLMIEKNISLEKGIIEGFTIKELEDLFDKCVEINLSMILLPYHLMKNLTEGENLKTLYKLEPIKKQEIEGKNGIFIYTKVDLNVGKPVRNKKIQKEEIKNIGHKIEKFNNLELSFESLMKLM